MKVRNPIYNAAGTIDVEIDHPVRGWEPFTASPDDPEEYGRLIHAAAASGQVASYEPRVAGMADFRAAIVAVLDAKAQERGYDDRLSIATYTGSNDAEYALEARTFVDWRDSIWRQANAELERVRTGQRKQPTIEAFLKELPSLLWPADHTEKG